MSFFFCSKIQENPTLSERKLIRNGSRCKIRRHIIIRNFLSTRGSARSVLDYTDDVRLHSYLHNICGSGMLRERFLLTPSDLRPQDLPYRPETEFRTHFKNNSGTHTHTHTHELFADFADVEKDEQKSGESRRQKHSSGIRIWTIHFMLTISKKKKKNLPCHLNRLGNLTPEIIIL